MKKRNGSGEREKGGGKEELVLFDMGKKEKRREKRESLLFSRTRLIHVCDDGLRGTTAGLFLWASVTKREKEEEEKGNASSGETPVGKLQLHSGEEEEEEEATAEAEASVTDR